MHPASAGVTTPQFSGKTEARFSGKSEHSSDDGALGLVAVSRRQFGERVIGASDDGVEVVTAGSVEIGEKTDAFSPVP